MATLNLQVGANADDGYCRHGAETFNATLGYTYLGSIAADAETDSFFRFTNVTIPQGATIVSATLTLTADANRGADTVRTNVAAEDADNPAAPTTYANMVARVRTTALVAWDFTTDWVADSEYSPGSLTAVIKEVVDRGGWSSGNALIIYVDNDASTDVAARTCYSYDGSAAKAATLDIEYTVPATAVAMDHYRRRRT